MACTFRADILERRPDPPSRIDTHPFDYAYQHIQTLILGSICYDRTFSYSSPPACVRTAEWVFKPKQLSG